MYPTNTKNWVGPESSAWLWLVPHEIYIHILATTTTQAPYTLWRRIYIRISVSPFDYTKEKITTISFTISHGFQQILN